MIDIKAASLALHAEKKGKLEIAATVNIDSLEEMAIAYTPGVAHVCAAIAENSEKAYDYTIKGRTVALISNGTAVLGLGNIGPQASLPIIEGKALFIKKLGGVDAFPIAVESQDADEIIATIKNIAPTFAGIHLEDIKAPECFYIESELQKILPIPVYHDDQHGTAIAVLAALINALKLVKKDKENVRVVICGAGASGIATGKLLLFAGFKNIVMVDKQGALKVGDVTLNWAQQEIAAMTNRDNESGTLEEILVNKDIFIGLSTGNIVTQEMVKSMAKGAIVFGLANPNPEIHPEDAKAAGAVIIATGRSDFPNQVNNILAFPGIFKGAVTHRLKAITMEMKIAAAEKIASLVTQERLSPSYIVPSVFEMDVADAVASAIAHFQ